MQPDQLLQGNNALILLAVCCCGMCGAGLLLSAITPFINILFGVLGMALDLAAGLFEAGPVPGCGCVVVAALIAAVVVVGLIVTSIASTCGTPQATNFCTLLGR